MKVSTKIELKFKFVGVEIEMKNISERSVNLAIVLSFTVILLIVLVY